MTHKVVGVTGGIASGKTSVSEQICERTGAGYISADEECRILLKKGNSGWKIIVETFGQVFLHENGHINRAELRAKLFESRTLREDINRLIHPLAHDAVMKKMLQFSKSSSHPFTLVEVPLLFEADWKNIFDRIIVVYAESSVIYDRLTKRDSLSSQAACKSMSAQGSLFKKALLADHVIDNSSSRAHTYLQIIHLVDNILLPIFGTELNIYEKP